ncbi:g4800 [Coccomyxa elongata]
MYLNVETNMAPGKGAAASFSGRRHWRPAQRNQIVSTISSSLRSQSAVSCGLSREPHKSRGFAASQLSQEQHSLHLPATSRFHSSASLAAQPARKPAKKDSSSGSKNVASTSRMSASEDARQQFARTRTGGRYQLPPVMLGANHVKLAPISPNVLVEPYKGELPPLPLVSWVTLSGWRERWHRTLGGVKAIYTLARCRKFVPGFSLPAFKADALLLYEEVCQAIAADDKTLLRQRMTPAAYGTVKAQLKAREDGGWKRVAWSLARRPQLNELELVHARLIAANPKDARSSFAQLTVRVRAAHKFAAYDGKRRLVAGDPENEVPVQDVWVLERSFKEQPTSRWRVAGRLSLPPVPPPTERWWNPMGWIRRLKPGPIAGASQTVTGLQA